MTGAELFPGGFPLPVPPIDGPMIWAGLVVVALIWLAVRFAR